MLVYLDYMAFNEIYILPSKIGEFGIVYKAFFKRSMNSETEVVAVKTLKGIYALLSFFITCN